MMANRPYVPSSEEIVREAAREMGIADLSPMTRACRSTA